MNWIISPGFFSGTLLGLNSISWRVPYLGFKTNSFPVLHRNMNVPSDWHPYEGLFFGSGSSYRLTTF